MEARVRWAVRRVVQAPREWPGMAGVTEEREVVRVVMVVGMG